MYDRAAAIERAMRVSQAERDRQAREWQRRWLASQAYRDALAQTPEIMNSLHGHPRGERGGVVTPGWVYDSEPWHWPPKERSVPMGITQEQFARSIEIRDHVEQEIMDAIVELIDDAEIKIKNKALERIVEAVASQLLLIGVIDLAKVEERL